MEPSDEKHPTWQLQPPHAFGWHTVFVDLGALATCFMVIWAVASGYLASGIPVPSVAIILGFVGVLLLALIGRLVSTIALNTIQTNNLILRTFEQTKRTHDLVDGQLTAFKEAIAAAAHQEITRQAAEHRAAGIEEGIQLERERSTP